MAWKKTQLPSEEELRELPRWARVAFAARCARCVQPLFRALWPKAPARHCEAIDRAVQIAEILASGGVPPPGTNAANAAAFAHNAANAAAFATAARHAVAAAANAADTAANAAFAARDAAKANDANADVAAKADDDAAFAAAKAAARAAEAAFAAVAANAANLRAASRRWQNTTIRAMRLDFKKLRKAAKKERWTNKTPVPPAFFGASWLEDKPLGWLSARIAYGGAFTRPFAIIVDADVDQTLMADFLAELARLYAELSDGDELVIRDGKVPVEAGVRL